MMTRLLLCAAAMAGCAVPGASTGTAAEDAAGEVDVAVGVADDGGRRDAAIPDAAQARDSEIAVNKDAAAAAAPDARPPADVVFRSVDAAPNTITQAVLDKLYPTEITN